MTATQERSAPTRRSRRAARGRAGSRTLSAIAGLVLVAAAVAVQTLGLTPNDRGAPISTTGSLGEDVDTGRFTVRVDNVAAARAVETLSAEPVATEQLFVVVTASATSAKEPLKLGQPRLITPDGVSYEATDKIPATNTLANPWVQPGFWVSGFFVFEVPASAVQGAKVAFGLPKSALVEPFEPEVEVDLGLDEAKAAQLTSAPQDVYPLKKS
ncbi:hypothetical protein [Nonomuraea dietziae]|uniref:hypothetical protein n=1 Tax=Nonomuraea dietziae TaxID=65515 RepID=UPI003420BA81